ncbi:AIPR family protein [Ancylobacter amanitiformis]|uniref:Abortive phage infection protein C-terminal domain-containing protein n=1 Tax=Ancylobacter amanitiformis TaxID=217069 RepID=A0ABU0LTD4_9HYPH|nr:AIPR family protein [Ancylobacter amanitiformis]MDQ0511962.1 hypothetical protein [Ancylobacter amanitiformis]
MDLSDVGERDAERDKKILSRCLAAHAVFIEAECTPEEAALSVWDGSDDNGIDAVFLDGTSERVIVVQSKWISAGAGEPSAADIGSFVDGINDLIEQNIGNFHARLQSKLNDAGQAILTPGCTVEVVLVSTGSSTIARHGTAKLDGILTSLNGYSDQAPIATKKVFGIEDIYSSLASASPGKIIIDATITDWSYVAHPYPAYFGIIDGYQLKHWWGKYGKRLVAKNIRHSLGATDVNDGIRSTAENIPGNFWYFNNGITLIADDSSRAPAAAASRSAGNFEFRGASIVNGAQTVSTLARVNSDEALGKVRVPIRIILLKDAPDGFGVEVTRTNNLQNRVEGRDFVAQDPEQRRIQQEMSLEDIDYQLLRSEDVVKSSHSCELIEVTTALACASGDAALAVQVKTGIGRFFSDLKKAPYKLIFNPSLNGAKAFNATLIHREIDSWIDHKKSSLEKRSGYAWGVLVHGNRVIEAGIFRIIGASCLDCPVEEFRNKISTLNISIIGERFHESMVGVLEKEFPGKFLAVLFKSPSSSSNVFNKAINEYTKSI